MREALGKPWIYWSVKDVAYNILTLLLILTLAVGLILAVLWCGDKITRWNWRRKIGRKR